MFVIVMTILNIIMLVFIFGLLKQIIKNQIQVAKNQIGFKNHLDNVFTLFFESVDSNAALRYKEKKKNP